MGKRALISVSDKTGIKEFASELIKRDFEIISTGGTAKILSEAGLPVTNVSDITGFPECLDGRVKTLHPNIHGGLLALRANKEHMKQLEDLCIKPIDIVVINLYPFKQTIQKPNVKLEEAIENIDIGGPSMLRSAAKNYKNVVVLIDPDDYRKALSEMDALGDVSIELRACLAAKVFGHTAHYDAIICDYLRKFSKDADFPENLTLTFEKAEELRYGENPHQKAAFYKEVDKKSGTLANARQLHGKQMSFNNINDTNAAIELIQEFNEPTVVAIKHANPCGVGSGIDIREAFEKAYNADKVSIFGGIIAANRQIDEMTAVLIKDIFIEVVIAPSFSDKAMEILTEKKNIRLLELADIAVKQEGSPDIKKVSGGILIQSEDNKLIDINNVQVVTERAPTDHEKEDLLFAWKVVKHVKSNAIVVAKNKQTLGIGAGQMNRIWAVEHALEHGKENTYGAVLASDAFFPFDDSVKAAAIAGISAIIEPGGSLKDKDSIEACNKSGIAMVFTGIRHFKH